MNAKGDANRSVRMTKQRLYQALITLLQQKSLREITVRELTELAGISRGTFYFHYADIYALMDQMEAAQLARLNDLMDTLIPSISQEDAPPRAGGAVHLHDREPRPLLGPLRQKLGVGVHPQRQKADCRALPGRVCTRRRHRGAEIYAGLCGERLLWHDCSLAGGRFSAARGGDRPHHLAGHPRCEGADVSEASFPCLPCLLGQDGV